MTESEITLGNRAIMQMLHPEYNFNQEFVGGINGITCNYNLLGYDYDYNKLMDVVDFIENIIDIKYEVIIGKNYCKINNVYSSTIEFNTTANNKKDAVWKTVVKFANNYKNN